MAQTNALPGEDGIKAVTVAPTGSTWTTAKSPSGSLGEVTALDASSSKNVWAFGTTGSHAYGARWNGTKWTTTTMTSSHYDVQDAEALSASNVWAGGVAFPEGDPDDPTGNGLYPPYRLISHNLPKQARCARTGPVLCPRVP